MKNRDIIIIGLQPWYTDIGSNCKNIALEFAKQNRVLYVNIPLNRSTLFKKDAHPHLGKHIEIINKKKRNLIALQSKLWNYYPLQVHESINWIPSTALFNFFNKINNNRFAEDILMAAESLGFKDFILFNDNDIFRGHYLKEFLKPSIYIYYCRDFLQGVDYFKKHGKVLEPVHIAKADMALANSVYLYNFLKNYNQNSYYVGQGCDLSLFDGYRDYQVPLDIHSIRGPLIGYVGTLTAMRLNMGVIETIAKARPSWNIVLAGPEDKAFRNSPLHNLKNVHFTGKKELQELPAYINAFDVCINPQENNPLTAGNYPLKIDEYLAMGKPVVATKTEAMKMFEAFTYLAETPADYIDLIETALKENSPEVSLKRMDFARSHTWENSVDEIYKAINHFENTNELIASYPGPTRNLMAEEIADYKPLDKQP